MIGYCAIASSGIEIRPTRQMKRATTQAKMGRSMKKLAMGGCLSGHRLPDREPPARSELMSEPEARGPEEHELAREFRRLHHRPRLDAVAGGELLEAVDDDAIARLQALDHQPAAVLRRTQTHRLQGGAIV